MSETSSPLFSAVGVVTIGDRRVASEPVVFDMSGAHLILQFERDGERCRILESNRVEPGVALLEKTCMEPVLFLVTRNDQPYQKVELKSMFGASKLDLTGE